MSIRGFSFPKMTTAILGILAALVPFAIWLYKRHAATQVDPQQQHENHREEIAKEIVRNDESSANRSLDADLDKLRSLQSDRRGQGSPPPPNA